MVTAVAPIGLRDRDAGTVTFTTSLGLGRKLERMRREPRVALAYHAREHGFSTRPEFVLVQGRATIVETPDRDYLEEVVAPRAERFLGERKTGFFWDRWLREYYSDRVPVNVQVERVTVWPDLRCAGETTVFGAPPPGRAESQRPPKGRRTAFGWTLQGRSEWRRCRTTCSRTSRPMGSRRPCRWMWAPAARTASPSLPRTETAAAGRPPRRRARARLQAQADGPGHAPAHGLAGGGGGQLVGDLRPPHGSGLQGAVEQDAAAAGQWLPRETGPQAGAPRPSREGRCRLTDMLLKLFRLSRKTVQQSS